MVGILFIFFMQHYTGLSLTTVSDLLHTMVMDYTEDGLILTIYIKSKNGDVKSCGIALNNGQVIALADFLNVKGVFDENK
jgi:hypothetical protein